MSWSRQAYLSVLRPAWATKQVLGLFHQENPIKPCPEKDKKGILDHIIWITSVTPVPGNQTPLPHTHTQLKISIFFLISGK